MHQCAHPDETDQGHHNTCAPTAEAESILTRNPSKAAEMVVTTALTGQWTAPDGKVITIDKGSLQPGVEESVYPSKDGGQRTFATQLLNLTMVNDALQRLVPPQYYVQRRADDETPGDTGERRLDEAGKVISAHKYDAASHSWVLKPDNSPSVDDQQLDQIDKRVNGRDLNNLDARGGETGADTVHNAREFAERLHQLQQQGGFPLRITVDANHTPIIDYQSVQAGSGYSDHAVSIDAYDEKNHRVYLSNQWGKQNDKWVDVEDLFNNAHGDKVHEK